jgi:elongation factor 3
MCSEKMLTKQNEPQLYKQIDELINQLAEHKYYEKTKKTIYDIIDGMNPIGCEFVLDILYCKFQSEKWLIKLGAIDILTYCSLKHPKIIGYYIPEIIEKLIQLSSEVKKEIKQAVKQCFEQVGKTIENVDIIHLIPMLTQAYMNPASETQNALDKLVSTPFVNDIDLPTLGFLTPLLIKSMRTRKMVYQRRAAVVMETLCKLIKNPVYAKMFYPRLAPELERGKEEIAEAEIRKVCENALFTLNTVYHTGLHKEKDIFTFENCRKIFEDIKIKYDLCNTEHDEISDYSCKLSFILAKNEILDPDYWNMCVDDYFQYIVDSEKRANLCKELKETIIQNIIIDEYNPEDNEENLCDCMFSLAYGTRVLLHQTPFKVKIGRKYGLVGPNGAGKSTLMKAIANKNLQEFPENLTCIYVEHDIQGNKSDQSVLNYVLCDTKIVEKQLAADFVNQSLLDIGFEEAMIRIKSI